MSNNSHIVITGIGPLTAGGSGKGDVWDSVKKRRTGLAGKIYEIGNESVGEHYVHEIRDFSIDDYDIDKSALGAIRDWKEGEDIVDLLYFLATARMALDDSRLKIDESSGRSIGLILVHENIGQDHFYRKVIDELSFTGKDKVDRPETKKEFLKKFYQKFRRTGYELQSFMTLHHVAKAIGVHGYSLFLNNACASGLFAIEAAADIVRSGKCKQVIVTAVDRSSIFKQMWFDEVKMLSKDGKIRPFAADRDGFTIGDGGAALVIESMDTALQRKAQIYAEYAGGGFCLEGWKVTYPDIGNDFYKDCMQRAMAVADVDPKEVGLIVPHGVATNITDSYEARAINDVFGTMDRKPIVSALKPYFGHTLGSSALLETAVMLLGLRNGAIPPTLNYEKPDKGIELNIIRDMASGSEIKVAMKTACGFAGYDGACIFRII
jgi:3-oxoacyl-(acyl-carrier-protein) synthase